MQTQTVSVLAGDVEDDVKSASGADVLVSENEEEEEEEEEVPFHFAGAATRPAAFASMGSCWQTNSTRRRA